MQMLKMPSKANFNPITYGIKLAELYNSDRLLGTVTIPWGVVFTIWMINRDPMLVTIIGYLSYAVAAATISSALKHIVGGFLEEYFKLRAQAIQDDFELKTQAIQDDKDDKESNTSLEVIKTEGQLNKEKAEAHYQMTTINKLTETTSKTAVILLDRAMNYIKNSKEQDKPIDHLALDLYVNTIKDLNAEMGKHNEMIDMPYKGFVREFFRDFEHTDYIPPNTANIPNVTVEEIEALEGKIESPNPTVDELKNRDI